MGGATYFSALTAHFGQWVKAVGSRRSKPQWQVAAGLLYGQVQKHHRRRKLVQVKHVYRLLSGEPSKKRCKHWAGPGE